MSRHNGPDAAADDRGELLAAYLEGDLDDVETRRLERRLIDDADLRAELDRIHEVLLAVRRVDEVEPPADLADRVRARVRASEAVGGPSEARRAREADTDPAGPPAARPTHADPPVSGPASGRRPATARWWQRPISVAAALALLGVVAVSSIGVLGSGLAGGDDESAGGDMSAMSAESGAEDAAREDAPADTFQDDDGRDAALDEPPPAPDGDPGAAEALPEALAPAEPGPTEVVSVVELDTADARQAYLAAVREAVEGAASPEADGGADAGVDTASSARARDVLSERDLEDACIDRLLPSTAGEVVQLLESELDGRTVVGALTSDEDGAFTLRLVDTATCEIVAEDVVPA